MGDQGHSPGDIERRIRKLESQIAKSAKASERSSAKRSWSWRPRRPWPLPVALLVIAALAATAYYVIPGLTRARGTDRLGTATSPARSTLPSPTMAAPFRGTPAQSYADGAAGILIPAAHPVGTYSAAQVAAAYQTTKQLLVAANLNQPTLAGGPPEAFASLLIPPQRTFFQTNLDKNGVNSQGQVTSTRGWVTSFAAGTRLAGKVIKVYGTLSATTGSDKGAPILLVHANYLFVYAVTWQGQPSTLTRIVDHYIVDVEFGTYTDAGGPLQPWWQPTGGGDAGAQCGFSDGYIHPQFPGRSPGKVVPKGRTINPYDLNTEPSGGPGSCQPTTGT